MKEMTSENAMFLLQGVYLPMLKRESQVTKQVMEAVPADKSGHRPDPISKSALELVRHIAASDVRFLQTVINGQFSTAAVLPESAKTPAEVVAWYEKQYATDLEALAKLTGEQLTKTRGFSRDVPMARGDVPGDGTKPHDSSPGAIELVLAMHGGEGALDLRRKLRRGASP